MAGRSSGNPANQPPNVAGLDALARRRRRRARLRQAVEASKAHVIRRDVEWLTASPQSSVSFTPLHELDGIITPNGLVLRAPSFRHRRGRSGRLPADAARPGRQAADLHARRHQAHAARQPRLFLRMRRQFRHGMARRAAQRLPVHPRHGALRDVYRRAAQGAAQRSRREAEREMAAAGRRRRRRDDALAAAAEGARRRAGRLSHERRDALSGKRLSGAHGAFPAGKPICG